MSGDYIHTLPVRIYYADTDAGGVVYHANYLGLAERARTELLRELCARFDTTPTGLGVLFAVRRSEVEYIRPARLDDLVEIRTRVTRIGGASLSMGQTIFKDGEVITEILVHLVCIDPDFRPTRVPDALRAEFARAAEATAEATGASAGGTVQG